MPRKNDPPLDTRWFDAACIDCIRNTTTEERQRIAVEWCMQIKNRTAYEGFAQARNLIPAALITVCLIEVDHPLVVYPNLSLKAKSLAGASIDILQAELKYEVVPIPVLVHNPCVQTPLVHRQSDEAER